LVFGKYPISDFHENAQYWDYLPILSITLFALFYVEGKFHLRKMGKKVSENKTKQKQQLKIRDIYIFLSFLMLADIDECASSVHDCHSSASCTNTVGSFSCSCNHPYTGDGKTCRLVAGKYVTFIFSSRQNCAIK